MWVHTASMLVYVCSMLMARAWCYVCLDVMPAEQAVPSGMSEPTQGPDRSALSRHAFVFGHPCCYLFAMIVS